MKRFHKDQLSAIIKLWYLEASNDLSQDHYHNSHVHRVSSRQLSVLGDKSATRFLLSKPKTSQHLWHFNNFFLHLHQAGHQNSPFPTSGPPNLWSTVSTTTKGLKPSTAMRKRGMVRTGWQDGKTTVATWDLKPFRPTNQEVYSTQLGTTFSRQRVVFVKGK